MSAGWRELDCPACGMDCDLAPGAAVCHCGHAFTAAELATAQPCDWPLPEEPAVPPDAWTGPA